MATDTELWQIVVIIGSLLLIFVIIGIILGFRPDVFGGWIGGIYDFLQGAKK
ncbi:MAG TPA: hypothetical protein VJH90_02660 [archaeon]|nr:hypothetical protein [archaeon]